MYNKKIRIAVSGSNGFIGGHLVNKLQEYSNVELIKLDISDGYDLTDQRVIEKVPPFNVFIHLAGLLFIPDSFIFPEKYYYTNFVTLLNALELCRKYNAKMVFLSSYVYGPPQYLPVDEKHPVNPSNPYTQSKVICEHLCEGYNRDFNVPAIILRPFNIFGENQRGKLLISEIISRLKNNEAVIKLKDSKPRRDYVYIDDAVDAIVKCAFMDCMALERFNIASNKSHSVLEITEIISQILFGKKIKFVFSEKGERKNEILETVGAYSLLNEKTGWYPAYSLQEGLERILRYENLI